MPYLIKPAQLDKFRKNQKNVVIIDATCRMPKSSGDAHGEYLEKHIKDARFLDLHAFVDEKQILPNMLSSDIDGMASKLSELGITRDHKVIFYDNSPMRTSCRALWMFKIFGHNPQLLYVLDGGLPAWEHYGGKVESGEPKSIAPKKYHIDFQWQYLRTLDQMKANEKAPAEQVIDVRNPVRYAGGKESREGLRSGHIPGSFSFPFTTMFEASGHWKPIEKIRKQLIGIGVDLKSPIVTTCGSGTTAPILNFALDLMDVTNQALYDGSWSEWGADSLYPGEQSLDERPVETSLDGGC